jgi:hypothetical protein
MNANLINTILSITILIARRSSSMFCVAGEEDDIRQKAG